MRIADLCAPPPMDRAKVQPWPYRYARICIMKERGLSTKLLVIISLGSLAFSCSAWAQKAYGPGANDREIRFGQTMSYSGPNSAFSVLGKVADGYFRKVNDEGGINGRKLISSAMTTRTIRQKR